MLLLEERSIRKLFVHAIQHHGKHQYILKYIIEFNQNCLRNIDFFSMMTSWYWNISSVLFVPKGSVMQIFDGVFFVNLID